MFKRLAPVIELSESCSESSSPAHKRSQTQHKTRFVSPMHSDVQVWQIIQSRRNLDKKMRLVKSRVLTDQNRKNCRSPSELGSVNLVNEKKKVYRRWIWQGIYIIHFDQLIGFHHKLLGNDERFCFIQNLLLVSKLNFNINNLMQLLGSLTITALLSLLRAAPA